MEARKKGTQGAQPRFSEANDLKLKSLVEQHGIHSWSQISRHFKNKSAKQCKDRWYNYLSPDVRKDPWSPEEDKLLEALYAEYGTSWKKISLHLDRRSPGDIRFRCLKLQRRNRKRNSNSQNINKTAKFEIPRKYFMQMAEEKEGKSSEQNDILWSILENGSERNCPDLFDMLFSPFAEEFYAFQF